MDKILFLFCIILLLAYGVQKHWFDGIGNFFGMIKTDIEYQRNYVPRQPALIDGQGIIEVEQETRTERRSGLGTVQRNR